MKEKKDINVEIGRNIQREREKAGYTQEGFPPRQFEVACKALNSLMEAFALSESGEST